MHVLAKIDGVAEQEILAGHIPGVVVLVGHDDRIVTRKAFGNRTVHPRPEPMRVDAVFDVASLTKVVATATAVLQLAERGRLRLDEPVAVIWPEFASNGKGAITPRQLLTHRSGLRVDVNPSAPWKGYNGALSVIVSDRPVSPPGSEFRYSDVNFIVLGEMVRRVSGLPLDSYCDQEIFKPLGMSRTTFRPPAAWRPFIAPSHPDRGQSPPETVQDPTAHRMGGVAGHAGVFSTADDLTRFALMFLDGGAAGGRRVLSAESVAAMTRAAPFPGTKTLRGLGWDMRSPYSREHTGFFPEGSFGHTGYTGPSMWIDPRSRTFLILLANRLHPDGKGQVKSLRAAVASLVAAAFQLGPPAEVSRSQPDRLQAAGTGAAGPSTGGPNPERVQRPPEPDPCRDDGCVDEPAEGRQGMDRLLRAGEAALAGAGRGHGDPPPVRPGIDVLTAKGFAPLVGRSVGLITNHTGLDSGGRSSVQVLLHAPGVRLRALFSPEHGLFGQVDAKIASGVDPGTGLPVHSLYGAVKRPTPEMLRGLDALVYDIQDVGARFYTYITTMGYAMEAAASAGIDFFVLDRPNPITASRVQGPLLDPALRSFVGYFPMPVRHGMTPGELALLFNREGRIGVRLHVVPIEGYRREAWLDETGLPWVTPSPNLRSLTQATFYPGVALVESANVSVGRGTETPFEVVGAPWISGALLARHLTARSIEGVAFEPVDFTPASDRFKGRSCGGVRLHLTDRAALDSPLLGVEVAAALHRLYPKTFELDRTLGMMGSRQVLQAIKAGVDPRNIQGQWQDGIDQFLVVRESALLY